MLDADRASDGEFPKLWRFLRVLESMVLIALIYSVAAFVAGWVLGGPDVIDGRRLFAIEGSPTEMPIWLRGLVFVLIFVASLVILYLFTPKPNAWLTRLAQRRGPVLTIIALIGIAILLIAAFLLVLVLTGSPLFLENLVAIASGGILAGGFLQLMAAAVLPNPTSDREQRILRDLVEKARRQAEEHSINPDEAEEVTRRHWAESGQQIGKVMQFLHGLIAAFGGGGVHGGLLFVIGASFFIGLGFGVSGSAVSLFYIVPLFVALADTATLYIGHALIPHAESGQRRTWAAALALPIGLLGMVCKALLLIVALAALHQLGGPEIPWRLYADAAIADPFAHGLAVSVLFLAGLAWPVLLFVGPVHREFAH